MNAMAIDIKTSDHSESNEHTWLLVSVMKQLIVSMKVTIAKIMVKAIMLPKEERL